MKKKQIREWAIILIIVFTVTIVVYPLIFGTDPHPKNESPVELNVKK